MSAPIDLDPQAGASELQHLAAEDYAAAQVDHEKQDHRDDAHPIAPDNPGGA